MAVIDLHPELNLVVQGGSFIACEETVTIESQFGGFSKFFSGEGLFWLQASGQGNVVLSAFGAIYTVDVEDEYICDSGHVVAFESTLDYQTAKVTKGMFASFFSGEGLVCRFKGHGRIWCQSHSSSSFGTSLKPHLKPIRKNG